MKNNLPLGVALTLLSAFLYSSRTAIVKADFTHLPPLPVIIFIQSFVALLLILPFLFKNGSASAKATLTTQKLHIHFLRTIFNLSLSFLLYYAITFIPFVNAMMLANTSPLIMPLLACLFLSQKVNHRLWIPMLIGYLGVAIVLQPDLRILNPASFLALGAAVASAAAMLTVRRLAATESTETSTFYFFFFSSILSGIISIKFWMPTTLHMMSIMLVIGILYFLTQYVATAALMYTEAHLFGSLFYSNILFAAVISQFVWNILPTVTTLFGMALIIIGGILCIYTESAANVRTVNLRQDALGSAYNLNTRTK